jgi:hypothetical protein
MRKELLALVQETYVDGELLISLWTLLASGRQPSLRSWALLMWACPMRLLRAFQPIVA